MTRLRSGAGRRGDPAGRGLALVAVALLAACGSPPAAPEGGRSPLANGHGNGEWILPVDSPLRERLRIEPVAAEPWSEDLELPARVRLDPRRVWRVTMPVPGRVVDVHVTPGERVAAGRPLLTLVSPEADGAFAAFRQAEADRRAAAAAVRQAEADLERMRDLFEHDAVARRDVLHAETALAHAEAERARAEAVHAQARDTLAVLGLDPDAPGSIVTLRAPQTGRVMEVAVAAGEYHGDTGDPLVVVADLSRVWIVSDVPEHRVAALEAGAGVDVRLVAFPGERFDGHIARLGHTIDAETRTLQVYVELENPDERLRPEMFATIRVAGESRAVPILPASAIIRFGEGAAVIVEAGEEGRLVRRAVRTGRPRGGRVPVIDGLAPGERVVVDGALLLAAGGRR